MYFQFSKAKGDKSEPKILTIVYSRENVWRKQSIVELDCTYVWQAFQERIASNVHFNISKM